MNEDHVTNAKNISATIGRNKIILNKNKLGV